MYASFIPMEKNASSNSRPKDKLGEMLQWLWGHVSPSMPGPGQLLHIASELVMWRWSEIETAGASNQ
jgi:hypothetical protein